MANNTSTKSKDPNRPKWQLTLTPVNLSGNILTVLVAAHFAGKPANKGTEISFRIDDNPLLAEPTKLDEHGRALVELTIPMNPEVKIEARTIDPGGQVSTTFKPSKEVVRTSESEIELEVESNTRGNGIYTQSYNIYTKKGGKGVAGIIRLIPPPEMKFKLNDVMVPIPGMTHYDLEVPAVGSVIKLTVLAREMELDALVLGERKKEQFKLHGPKPGPIKPTPHSPSMVRFFAGCEVD